MEHPKSSPKCVFERFDIFDCGTAFKGTVRVSLRIPSGFTLHSSAVLRCPLEFPQELARLLILLQVSSGPWYFPHDF